MLLYSFHFLSFFFPLPSSLLFLYDPILLFDLTTPSFESIIMGYYTSFDVANLIMLV